MNKKVHIPPKTAADHKALIALLVEITEIGKSFKANGGSPTNIEASVKTLPVLTAKWDEMVTLMLPHLAEEEEQFVTFIKDAFNKKEIDATIQKILKHEGLSGARLFLPSILE